MRSRDGVLILAAIALAAGVSTLGYLAVGAWVSAPVDDLAQLDAAEAEADLANAAAGEAEAPAPQAETLAPGGGPGGPEEASAPAMAGDAVAGVAPATLDADIARGGQLIDLDTDPLERVQAAPEPGAPAAPTPEGGLASADQGVTQTPQDALQIASALGTAPTPEPRRDGEGVEIDDRPSFDMVRVEPDGSAVLAGRARPGALVDVIVDGQLAEQVTADSRGEFVALISAPAQPNSDRVRRIDLATTGADGAILAARAPVIVTLPSTPAELPVVVRPDEEGVALLQPTVRRDAAGVVIDSVSYGEDGAVLVSGRGAPGQQTRVYLDNALAAEAQVAADGSWRARLVREVAPAVYTLRVDQMSVDGLVTGRAETPFERAAVEDILLENGSVVVQPGNNLWRIADALYGEGERYTIIFASNREQIRDPDLIYPGQVLALPSAPAAAAAAGAN